MHHRLIELAATSDRRFLFACAADDVDDSITLADAQGWVEQDRQLHATGILITFERSPLLTDS